MKMRLHLVIFGVTVALLLATTTSRMGVKAPSSRTIAMNDSVQIVNAVRNFHFDHRRYPRITENGFCETEETNAALIRVLTGNDPKENPKQIKYLEFPEKRATPPAVVRNGLDLDTGAMMDPWGNFYRIRIPTNSPRILNPYPKDEPAYLEAECLVWSVGKDGIQGKQNNSGTINGSDDVISWKTR